MKKSFVLFFLLTGFISLFSQAHFITAGQTSNMIFTDYVPDYEVAVSGSFIGGPNQTITYSLNLPLDINRDGVDDFKLHLFGTNETVPQECSAEYDFLPLNQNSVFTKLDSGWTVAKNYLQNDLLLNTIDTFWRGYPLGVLIDYKLTDPYYYFLRVIDGSDTLLGYIHLAMPPLGCFFRATILDFACEGPTSSHIISSLNNLTPFPLSISPNPFTSFINITTEKPFQYSVCDYTGRVVLSGVADNIIATEEFASGAYILSIKNEEMVAVKKIVKY